MVIKKKARVTKDVTGSATNMLNEADSDVQVSISRTIDNDMQISILLALRFKRSVLDKLTQPVVQTSIFMNHNDK